MSEPYIGEIRMFAGNFAPAGWQFCDGSLLPISENEALFQLIGTTYGGDGQNTFAVPDLRGRVPIHQGQGYVMGETGGVEQVTLTNSSIPAHSHSVQANSNLGTTNTPGNGVWAKAAASVYVADAAPGVAFNGAALSSEGGSQPHENRQPFLAISFIISLFGIFPSPS